MVSYVRKDLDIDMTRLINTPLLPAICMAIFCAGCQTKAQTGALVGAGSGAAVGGAIGSVSHSRAGAGAAIGAGVGAIGGYIVGNEMDKADQRERERQMQRNSRAARESRYDGGRIVPDDVIAWTRQGVKEEVIIDRIQRSGVIFHLSPQEENRLRDAGVAENVVRAMKDTARQYDR